LGDGAILYALIVRIPEQGADVFQEYEARVLPLLSEHGGVLQRRVRSEDRMTEIHLVGFPSQAVFDAYRDDPRRSDCAPLMVSSGAVLELLRVEDVDPPLAEHDALSNLS
jgi:hypothetical protein